MAIATNGTSLSRGMNRPMLGLIVKMPAESTIELAGHAGFDYALIDTEHGSADMRELENHVRAADSAGIRVLVRVSDVESPDILRALDAGADGVVVPHVQSAEDVAQAVGLASYPPRGRRSLALSTRAGRYGTRTVADHIAAASQTTVVIVQIEDAQALERLEEIVAATGLHGVFIGPSDLSASLGVPGRLDHPVVAEAVDRVAGAVVSEGDIALCVLANDDDDAKAWIERGARMILFNAPTLMASSLQSIAESVAAAPYSSIGTQETSHP